MARETKEERLARQAAAEAAEAARTAEFRKQMPERLMKIEKLAKQLGVQTEVTLTADGPVVHLRQDYDNGHGFDDRVSYHTDEWEVEHVERKLREIEEEQNERIRKRGIAEDVWANKLTPEQRAALKENIYLLR